MLEIGKTLVSLQLINSFFCCDLAACKGACCVEGDSGAPLSDEEISMLKEDFDKIQPFMTEAGVQAVKDQGVFVVDNDYDRVTPLIGGRECAFAVFDHGIASCAIEKAFEAKATALRKPVSCHLYPVRIRSYQQYDAVNYDEWHLCQPARQKGMEMGMPVYRFVREALIRKYGSEWYEQLDYAAQHLEITR
ncbi:MAG: DUF3109 family protein [Bacteroidales bacterium]|nr:DUF3109 family protein [Bacteroidales bacterium]